MDFAIDRVDQWVASLGFSSRVLTITASTLSSVMVRTAPGRGSSNRPSRRRSTKRRRHLPTVAWLTRRSWATCWLVAPVAPRRTMRARRAMACALLRRLANRSSVDRSSSVNTSATFGRPLAAMSSPIVAGTMGRTRGRRANSRFRDISPESATRDTSAGAV